MKTVKNYITLLVIICCFTSVTKIFSQNTIRVQDGKIFTSCNEEIVMRGVNEMFIWSQDRTGERILPEIAKTKSNAVRLVWTTEGAENEFDALINNSIKNKMIPVAELHDATGDFSKLQQLLDYWKKPAVLATIQKYKKWLIVNIGNEVGNGSESTAQWVNYYKDAITQLRDAGIDTPLMIDCGGYGNRESYFLEGGNELLEFDPLKNIIFAVHTYWTNGDDQAKVDRLNAMITEAKSKKLPYIIGEGPQKVASPVACGQSFPYVEMMKRLQEESIGWLSWSWGAVDNNDCGSPNSELDITTDGKYGNWATQFAEEMCVTDVNSIQNTSIIPPSMLDPSVASCGTTYTINASTNVAGGTISPSGNVIVSEGDNQIFDITSNIGFKIGDVLVDGTSVGAVTTYTFSNVSANHTIKVIYEDVPLPPQLPYVDGKPQAIPGKIKATSFDLGGETVAYHDTTSGNDGDGIRQEEDVDTEFGGDGGNIGYTADGEWIEYTVNVLEPGIYTIDVLVASAVSNGVYHIEFDGKDVTGLQNVSATGGWTNYSPQKISNIMLDAGEQVMRMFIDKGSFNYSTITFTKEGGSTNNPPTASFTSSIVSGLAPLTVNFDASSSSDPDEDAITYTWNFDDGTLATGVTASHTFLQARDYNVTLTVSDGTLQSSQTKIISVREDNTPVNCTFNTPMNTALPSISKTYDYIFVLGNGPDLSNVTNFGINWGLANNGLWQLSMSTNNGSPSWWVNFLPKVMQNFNQPQPEITITGSGFTGLDGEYWVTLDSGNFVLVSKTGQFTIYFSTTNVKPICEITTASRFQQNDTIKTEEFIVWPNPVEDIISIAIPIPQNVKSNREMFLFNLNGQIIKKKKFNKQQSIKIQTSDLAKGVYLMEIRNNDTGSVTIKKIIKK
ncbi:cellulase family glycosylhydrolase [uncultured Tenacibaculum sp.]|uniref:cellulase family glycosylhydrolase n=1 Tax=uncultured Tenacibaculum sp. TaxID=174713 RepID=UPI002602B56C|nr:cellulase family glycosylhydrolase [uncultured Tenacibaculum sp.]